MVNRKRNIYAAMVCCAVCGIVAFSSAWSGISYAAPLQFIGVCFFTALIYITVRYCMTEFTYTLGDELDEDSGETEKWFAVSRKVGSRVPVMEFKMKVSELTAIYPLSPRGTFAGCNIDKNGMKLYHFTVGMLCGGKYLLEFTHEGDRYGAVVEPTEDMLAALIALSDENISRKG